MRGPHRRFLVERPSPSGGVGLDVYSSTARAVHALKRKWTGYTGPCIRIRRSSDNAEQDIGFTSAAIDAAVSSAIATAFAGAGDAFVTKIYDQSGHGDHWVQGTSTQQPRVVAAGVWDGFVRFDGSNDSMGSTNNAGTVAAYHMAALIELRSLPGSSVVLFEQGTALGGDGTNDVAWTYPADVSKRQRLWLSAAANFQYVYFDAGGSDIYLPTLAAAHMASWNFASAGSAPAARLFAGASEAAGTWVNGSGSVSTSTIGSAVKRFLAGRNNNNSFAGINWAGDAFFEGTVGDADKTAIQAILQR